MIPKAQQNPHVALQYCFIPILYFPKLHLFAPKLEQYLGFKSLQVPAAGAAEVLAEIGAPPEAGQSPHLALQFVAM